MGWFDEQIRERIRDDEDMMQEAYEKMASAVTGHPLSQLYDSDRIHTQEAISEILRFYHIKSRELPDTVTKLNEALEFLLRPSGVMRRTVRLTEKWYKDAYGAMLASTRDGRAVALIPGHLSGYYFNDPETGKRTAVGKDCEDLFEREVICFYRPMPVRKMNFYDFGKYVFGTMHRSDLIILIGGAAAVAVIGLAVPAATQYLYSRVSGGSSMLLMSAVMVIFLTGLSAALLTVYRTSAIDTLKLRVHLSTEAAAMMRLLALPVDFFKKYSSGDLANRAAALDSLSDILIDTAVSSGLTAVFSLIYIGEIFAYAPSLSMPAFLIILITFVLTVITSFRAMKENQEYLPEAAKEYGMVYSLFGGVEKIKNAGAEKRAFAKWAGQYSRTAGISYNRSLFLYLSPALSLAVTLFGTLAIYWLAIRDGVSVENYMAFVASYGVVSGAFSALAAGTAQISLAIPAFEMAKPILEAVPEISVEKPVIEKISGAIEMNNVSFRYADDMPNVIDNLSLKIRPGEYVAIVGRTGCGKSTLMRILLGFEKPQKGAVYYDGRDINSVDIKSLRKKIGVVLQSGRLFNGDIFSNISISAPDLTMDGAWEAARMSGMAEDIENMPMGMQTLISEGTGGISGGQRQRLLIARAIAPKPKVLMFDEATSALDNLTQKQVSQSLDSLKCTRLVIAHRLSTIRNCSRILVLDKGKIAEQGTYEELAARHGIFSELVARQQVGMNTEEAGTAENQ
jgi:NHLM bacteriocin system ABC transporter ATP-binding protein